MSAAADGAVLWGWGCSLLGLWDNPGEPGRAGHQHLRSNGAEKKQFMFSSCASDVPKKQLPPGTAQSRK